MAKMGWQGMVVGLESGRGHGGGVRGHGIGVGLTGVRVPAGCQGGGGRRWPLVMWVPGRFPPQHFGKLYGLAMALSALVALLQYPCVALVQGPLQGDPFYVSVPCGPPEGEVGGCSTGKWGSYPGRGGVLPPGEMGVSSHGKMGILVLPMRKCGSCPRSNQDPAHGKTGVLPHGEMGMLPQEGWSPSLRSDGVLCHEKWVSCSWGKGGAAPSVLA